MTAFPVHHQLLEPTQTYVHQVGDAIQPSHSLRLCISLFVMYDVSMFVSLLQFKTTVFLFAMLQILSLTMKNVDLALFSLYSHLFSPNIH